MNITEHLNRKELKLKIQNTVEWTELLFHAVDLGFEWNYAHEILRIFQDYDRVMEIDCCDIKYLTPLEDEYIGSMFLEMSKKDGDLNQMGRDIVYDFMQKHNVKKMMVYQDK